MCQQSIIKLANVTPAKLQDIVDAVSKSRLQVSAHSTCSYQHHQALWLLQCCYFIADTVLELAQMHKNDSRNVCLRYFGSNTMLVVL